MPQFLLPSSTLRLLSSSSSLFARSFPLVNSICVRASGFSVLSYTGRRGSRPGGEYRRRRDGGGGGYTQKRGSSGSSKEGMAKERPRRSSVMEVEEGNGELVFNRNRAEGKEKSGKKKSLELKTRKLNPVNTTCYVQILGTGMDTQDTSPSILLFFDRQRFIFNAGEGLQRFCTEHKIKLSKIDHIFLTRVCSETAGGLPGLVLTLAGIGEEGIATNIWGPSDLNFLVEAMKFFIPNRAMLHAHSFGASQGHPKISSSLEHEKSEESVVLIDDEVVRISAMFLKPRYPETAADELETDVFGIEVGMTTKPGETAVVYACELPEVKGKFDPVKASSLGLKPGPKYRDLQLGNSVTSDLLNITVHPDDVLGPSSPGPVILLVDCPTSYHMSELFSLHCLNCFYTDASTGTNSSKKVNCVIHIGPASITGHLDYQKWMARFADAEHIMAGHGSQNMNIPILHSSARISSRLNYLCPHLFPVSGYYLTSQQESDSSHDQSSRLNYLCPQPFTLPRYYSPSEQENDSSHDRCTNFEEVKANICQGTPAENLLKFHLRPLSQFGFDKSAIPTVLTHREVIKELISEIPVVNDISRKIGLFWPSSTALLLNRTVMMVEEPWMHQWCSPFNATENRQLDVSEQCESDPEEFPRKRLKNNQHIPSCLENVTREDMEITLLGTGSSQPSKYRNVSAIFVNLFDRGGVLLDCGEGTLAQLKRRFGLKGADDVVKSLRCIWVSHIHADHHTGLARILSLRCKLLRGVPHDPLIVIGPKQMERFLNAYSALEDLDMHFIDCRRTLQDPMESLMAATPVESAELLSTLFAPGSRMESYKKKPLSPDNASATLTGLREVLHGLGLETLYSVPVWHCPEAFGVVMKAKSRECSDQKTIPGWKLVYSGDTRPCPRLIEASKDATVLIHEATFEDSLREEAIARNHSTTKEAIGVGTSAGAYRTILTHFSQRYPKIPVIDESEMETTCVAFDLMSVNLADLPVLPMATAHLKALFRNDLGADEPDDIYEAVGY